MSDNLKKFLVEVTEKPELKDQYKKDKKQLMDKYNLTPEEQDMVANQDLDAINKALNNEYDLAPNSIIRVCKKEQ
ncbi:hypothetical protein [Pleionea litopenaei]|uniref:Extradiol ring-cleavage dioxygenase LigAB LigA subunit domain-containing protein n=1 Tax=Pleionea litopenaei TaxID=3070815 RepID=A0AA51RU08_9GAMM|nr:hypothetical protein [Pleionea sp. HL-JVS1]WMS87484.1 hypothetical protein Q9312_00805 [Pleionea sp. HL-JVS1]